MTRSARSAPPDFSRYYITSPLAKERGDTRAIRVIAFALTLASLLSLKRRALAFRQLGCPHLCLRFRCPPSAFVCDSRQRSGALNALVSRIKRLPYAITLPDPMEEPDCPGVDAFTTPNLIVNHLPCCHLRRVEDGGSYTLRTSLKPFLGSSLNRFDAPRDLLRESCGISEGQS